MAPFPIPLAGYPWLSLVILFITGTLVIAGYPWLPHDYFILPRLRKISANDGKDNCK